MRDLKTVILLLIPLVVVAGGIFTLNSLVAPDAPEPFDGGGIGVRQPGPAPDGRAARKSSGRPPPIEIPRGNSTLMRFPPERVPHDGEDDGIVTLGKLQELLAVATGDDPTAADAAWRRIEELLKTGILADPVQAQVLLVNALGKGKNNAIWAAKLIPWIRDEAARERAALELLDLASESRDEQVLKAAFEALGQVAGGDAVEVLGQLVRSLDLDGPATAAIYAIAQIGTVESARELADLLLSRQGTALEVDLVKAIGRVKLPEMVEALAEHLRPESPGELRLLAVRALGLTRLDAAVAPLKTILADSNDMTLKGTALQALSRVGSKEAVDELIRLHKEDGELSFAAGLAIGNVEGESAVKPLLEAYDGLKDTRVKVRWVEALGNSGSDEALPKLREILESGKEVAEVRGRAAVSLARLGDSKSVVPIVSILESTREGDTNLIIQITEALRKMAIHKDAQTELVEKALPVLEKMTANPSRDVEYYYAEQAKRVIENLAIPRDRK